MMDPDDLVDYDGEKVPVKDLTNDQIQSVITRLDDEKAVNSAHARYLAHTANDLREELNIRETQTELDAYVESIAGRRD
jgi:hypothetical protein